jgi:hypothetical protein
VLLAELKPPREIADELEIAAAMIDDVIKKVAAVIVEAAGED